MKFILGKKLEMSQIFKEDGTVIPVTAVVATDNVIAQIKTKDKDGYIAVQVGYGVGKHNNKAKVGHLKGLDAVGSLKEFRMKEDELSEVKRGDKIGVEAFSAGDGVDVIGFSKGKGFQGVVKRHGFHGQKASHGHKDQERMPGSIGAGGVQRVFRGVRMAGRMGGDQVTVKGLEIISVDPEKNILYIKGALPGARNGLVIVSGEGKLEVKPASAEAISGKKDSTPVIEAKEGIRTEEAVVEEVVNPIEEVKVEAPTEEVMAEEAVVADEIPEKNN